MFNKALKEKIKILEKRLLELEKKTHEFRVGPYHILFSYFDARPVISDHDVIAKILQYLNIELTEKPAQSAAIKLEMKREND